MHILEHLFLVEEFPARAHRDAKAINRLSTDVER